MVTQVVLGASPSPIAANVPDLENTLCTLESTLSALGMALHSHDSDAIDHHANTLHRTLELAVDHFTLALRMGTVPSALRQRLVRASCMVVAQRESLAKATAALDRAIDVLLPSSSTRSLYTATGLSNGGNRSSGMISA